MIARRSVLVAVLLGPLAFAACVLKADGFTGGVPDAGAAANTDGGTATSSDGATLVGDVDSGGTSTTTDSRSSGSTAPNLLVNGDFELGCAGWDVSFGFVSESSEAHGGTGSCKFCMDTNFEALLSRDATVDAKKGDTYVADVWMKAADTVNNLKAAGYIGNSLQVESTGDSPDFTDGPVLDGSWQHNTTLVTLTQDTNKLTFHYHLQQSGNPAQQGNVICVYVDDAAIRKSN